MFAITVALDQRTPMLYLIQNMTKIESRTHQYWKVQTSQTKIVRRRMHICSPIRYVANTSWSKANLVAYIFTVHHWNLHYDAHRRWSFRFHQIARVSSEQTNVQSWRLDNPLQYGAQSNNSILFICPSKLKIKNIQIKNSWPNHVHELRNKTLWWPHHHGSGPNTTNLVHPRSPIVEFQHRSCKNSALVV